MKQIPIISQTLRSDTAEEGELDLGTLSRTLWRGKIWVLICGWLALMGGGYYAYELATPVYTANALVALESREQNVVDIDSVVTGLSGDFKTINTEVEVLRSRSLIERLVLDMSLTQDPEFNTTLVTDPGFSFNPNALVGWVREQISGPQPPAPPPSERAVLDGVIDRLRDAVSISNVNNSFVFQISVVTQGATKSAAVANRLAELYIDDQIAVKFEKTRQATLWLSARVAELQVELEEAQADLKAFSSGTDLVNAETLVALDRQLKDLRDRRETTTAQAEAAKSRLQLLKDARDSGDAALAQQAGDSLLDQAFRRLQNGLSGARQAFETRADAIILRAELEASRAAAQLSALSTSIEEVSARIDTQSEELVQLEQLQREVEANRLLYEAFLSRLKETSIQQGIQQADSRILSTAVVPPLPSAPRKARILSLSLILGLMAGASLVLLREMMQNTFRVAEELEARTGYAVIGQIPNIPARRRKPVLKYLAEKPNSAAAEAIRNLRTSVLLANLDNPPKVIMSTSSVPGEGKTTQSIALAQNLSGLGSRVLLLEGDLRRRVFSQYFDRPEQKGFLSVLAGEVTLEEALVRDDLLKADILFGEKSPINAADLFSSDKFRDFVQMLRDRYDYIIIDTPPVLAVPDARVVGQSVDAILYSVKWDKTSHRQVLDGLRAFESVNLKVSGLVLSQIDKRGMKRYGYGDSYGAYQSYYET